MPTSRMRIDPLTWGALLEWEQRAEERGEFIQAIILSPRLARQFRALSDDHDICELNEDRNTLPTREIGYFIGATIYVDETLPIDAAIVQTEDLGSRETIDEIRAQETVQPASPVMTIHPIGPDEPNTSGDAFEPEALRRSARPASSNVFIQLHHAATQAQLLGNGYMSMSVGIDAASSTAANYSDVTTVSTGPTIINVPSGVLGTTGQTIPVGTPVYVNNSGSPIGVVVLNPTEVQERVPTTRWDRSFRVTERPAQTYTKPEKEPEKPKEEDQKDSRWDDIIV